MIDSLNIDLLQVFIVVSEQKSINKSSEILLLSQPAISKKIKQLESYFNTKLFERSSSGMSLTPAGKEFYQKAKLVLNDFQALHQVENNNLPLKKLRIGALDNIASIWYPNFFKRALFNARSLKLSNEVMDLITPFNEDNLDLIFLDSPFKRLLTKDYKEKELYCEPYVLLYSKHNEFLKDSKKEVLTSKDLQQLKFIMHPRLCPVHDRLVNIFSEEKLELPEIYEVDFVESRLALVTISDLITILPLSLAKQKLKNNDKLFIKKLDKQFVRKVSLFSDGKADLDEIIEKLD